MINMVNMMTKMLTSSIFCIFILGSPWLPAVSPTKSRIESVTLQIKNDRRSSGGTLWQNQLASLSISQRQSAYQSASNNGCQPSLQPSPGLSPSPCKLKLKIEKLKIENWNGLSNQVQDWVGHLENQPCQVMQIIALSFVNISTPTSRTKSPCKALKLGLAKNCSVNISTPTSLKKSASDVNNLGISSSFHPTHTFIILSLLIPS